MSLTQVYNIAPVALFSSALCPVDLLGTLLTLGGGMSQQESESAKNNKNGISHDRSLTTFNQLFLQLTLYY